MDSETWGLITPALHGIAKMCRRQGYKTQEEPGSIISAGGKTASIPSIAWELMKEKEKEDEESTSDDTGQ